MVESVCVTCPRIVFIFWYEAFLFCFFTITDKKTKEEAMEVIIRKIEAMLQSKDFHCQGTTFLKVLKMLMLILHHINASFPQEHIRKSFCSVLQQFLTKPLYYIILFNAFFLFDSQVSHFDNYFDIVQYTIGIWSPSPNVFNSTSMWYAPRSEKKYMHSVQARRHQTQTEDNYHYIQFHP
jgi:hypothetical protein